MSNRVRVVARNLNDLKVEAFQVLCHVAFLLQVAILAVLPLLTGCSKRYDNMPVFAPFDVGDYENGSVGRFKTSFLIEQIDQFYRGTNPGPIGVTTLVNLDDLYTTSTFGRMYSEQLMSELSMRGFDVVELRHSDALQFLASEGEFALSRDAGFVRRERELGGVIVGTYVASPQRVYVNARLIDPSSSRVLSAGSVEMDKTTEISKLLRGGSMPATLERIPVKHVGLSAFPLSAFPNNGAGRVYDLEESGGAQDSFRAPVRPRFTNPTARRSSESSRQESAPHAESAPPAPAAPSSDEIR